jgi:uncharacterized membrane protein YccC
VSQALFQPEYRREAVHGLAPLRPPLTRRRGIRIAKNDRIAEPKTQPPNSRASWRRVTFAVKTTVSALLALFVAFAFDLDQPKWALLTVFIVAQPQSGLVLAKSFFRVVGTLIGAAAALLVVALFAQERVLFLGALALWIGFCTFASQYARSFAAYAFVLSGYTAAIVGIPGALDAGNAFYVAQARVTEICLGILVTATISHLVLPSSLAGSLRQAIAAASRELADYAVALLGGGNIGQRRAKLLSEGLAIKNLRASAIFEDSEVRDRSDALARLDAAFANAINTGQLLRWQLDALCATTERGDADIDQAIGAAIAAIEDWRHAVIDASQLRKRLLQAGSMLPVAEQIARDAAAPDAEIIRKLAIVPRLHEFFSSIAAYAQAYKALESGERRQRGLVEFASSNDLGGAIWAGLRAALALVLVGTFWIVANWPSGPTSVILTAVVTARLATMENAGKAAIGATLVVLLATFPAFIVLEMLLPYAQGFEMFALIMAPVLFLCAFLMGDSNVPLAYLAGFLFALDFASLGAFQNRMTYDAIGFVNTQIAVIIAIAVAAILFAVVAPETPEVMRHRFTRAARQALARIAGRRPMGLDAFETAMTGALERLNPEQAADAALWETGTALLGAGRELIGLRREPWTRSALRTLEIDFAALARRGDARRLELMRIRLRAGAAAALNDLRSRAPGGEMARASARTIAAFSAIGDALERGGALLVREA